MYLHLFTSHYCPQSTMQVKKTLVILTHSSYLSTLLTLEVYFSLGQKLYYNVKVLTAMPLLPANVLLDHRAILATKTLYIGTPAVEPKHTRTWSNTVEHSQNAHICFWFDCSTLVE